MKEYKSDWEAEGCQIQICESPFAVLVATDIMVRTWTLPEMQQALFIDSTGKVDATGVVLTNVLCRSAVGGLPVCYLLTC